MNEKTINWLLEGDPVIRWQVQRDIICASGAKIERTRNLVQSEGWGAMLLALQDEDGKWSGRLYNKKWVSTTYTMLLLKDMGIPANESVLKGCAQLFEGGIYKDREFRFSKGQLLRDDGVTGLVLSILCHFGYPDSRLNGAAQYLIHSQNENGSWYYDDTGYAEKYVFETTLIVLKALMEYLRWNGGTSAEAVDAVKGGQEFLLSHRLYKSLAGDIINKKWLAMPFPYYWFYDVITALDYFRACGVKDERLGDAAEVIRKKQGKDGTWRLSSPHAGAVHFEMEETGKPSRWNTLRCLRVLRWWEG